MKLMQLLLLLVSILTTSYLSACEEDAACNKCTNESDNSLNRFYSLEDKIAKEYLAKNNSQVKELSEEYLELAASYKCDWNYGNAIHDSNRFLGLINLNAGNIDDAVDYLLKAGKSPGSPQLDTFGPELDLANELLKSGKTKAVEQYLNDIKSFWEMNDGRIDAWLKEIENGGQPELSRFSADFGIWQQIIFWLSACWPIIIVALTLFFSRKRIANKLTFTAISIISAYISMFVINLGAALILPSMVSQLAQNGNEVLLMIVLYGSMTLVYAIPLLLIFAIARVFISRYETKTS